MPPKFRLCTDAEAADLEDALWEDYYAQEIAARGLRPGDSLDTRLDGSRVVPPVTTRYAYSERVGNRATEKLVHLDDWAQSRHGRVIRVRGRNVTLDSAGVDKAGLPADVRDWIDGVRPAAVIPNIADRGKKPNRAAWWTMFTRPPVAPPPEPPAPDPPAPEPAPEPEPEPAPLPTPKLDPEPMPTPVLEPVPQPDETYAAPAPRRWPAYAVLALLALAAIWAILQWTPGCGMPATVAYQSGPSTALYPPQRPCEMVSRGR